MSSSGSASVTIQCSSCQTKLRLPRTAFGKTIACPKCGHKMKLKESSSENSELVPATAIPVNKLQSKAMIAPVLSNNTVPEAPFSPLEKALTPTNTATPTNTIPSMQPGYLPNAMASKKLAKRSQGSRWIWAVLAGVGVVFLVVIGGLFLIWPASTSQSSANQASASPPADRRFENGRTNSNPPAKRSSIFSLENSKLTTGVKFGPNLVMHHQMLHNDQDRPVKLNIFIPSGTHPDKSLPVMFESPAGTNLLHGAEVEYPDPSTEYLPFSTQAGMITVTFSTSGPMVLDPSIGQAYWTSLGMQYKAFVASDAGVADGRLAIDFVLKNIPSADPERLYVWGHSSAATLALLLASKDHRIKKCISMAPITDLNLRLGELQSERSVSKLLPNLGDYFKSGSPISYVDRLQCPVFISHARDDDNEPFAHTEKYVGALRGAGAKVNFLELPSAGHYQPMIEASMPKAIEWLQGN